MVHLHSCWSPCFWHGNVADGSIAVAVYTFSMAVCIIMYCINVLSGGDSSQLWLPFFETNLNLDPAVQGVPDTTVGTAAFVIAYFLLLALLSGLLAFAVKTDIRGLMLPWMVAMWVVVVFQVMFGLWLVFGYYIYIEVIFVALCDWLWTAFNVYCIYVVRSHYRNVKYIQSPDIEYVASY